MEAGFICEDVAGISRAHQMRRRDAGSMVLAGGGTAPRCQLPSGSGMDVVTRHSPLATHYDSCHRTISVADAVVSLWRLTNPILQSMLPIGVRANLGHPKASPFSNDTNGSEGPARQDGGK